MPPFLAAKSYPEALNRLESEASFADARGALNQLRRLLVMLEARHAIATLASAGPPETAANPSI